MLLAEVSMESIGVNSNVYAGGKVFHIQTAGNLSSLLVKAEIFDSGRIVTVHQKKLDPEQYKYLDTDRFRDVVAAFHQDIAWEIELLFFIRDRIKTIKHAVSSNKIGLLFLHKGLVDEAIAEFENAITINPQMVESYRNLGLAFVEKKETQKAIEVLHKAIELEPRYADLHNSLGLAYALNGELDTALQTYETALAINPNYLEVHLNIGMVILRMHAERFQSAVFAPSSIKPTRVINELQKLMNARTEFINYRFFSFRFEKAIRQIQDNDFLAAILTLKDIREATQTPNLDETMHGFYLKFLFGGAGKDEKVLGEYRARLEKSVEEHPHFADLHNSLGVVYLIQCRNLFIKAMSAFKKAYEINPSYKSAYKNFRLVQNDGREFLNLLRAILK